MTKQIVQQGRRYRAKVSLGFIERLASNDMVAQRFIDLGFTEVVVTGEGAERSAEGLWPLPNAEGEMPSQVTWFTEI